MSETFLLARKSGPNDVAGRLAYMDALECGIVYSGKGGVGLLKYLFFSPKSGLKIRVGFI